ncbi:hypothetical protein HPB48_000244 [Haemaphysalis longicornis]|uniref:Uncharacterized protein n=1 Tax=Haemaphysalis longicornis TaxID=44386 RepID=A0A9J6FLE8_HAELO|nr:hypothetical protein HPB48_000244 [Haemaphysalis longicornis]
MDSPLYDVALGSVLGVRDPNDPDPNLERTDAPKTFDSHRTETVANVKFVRPNEPALKGTRKL